MIGKLTGRLSGTGVAGEVLIEVGGVGYCVRTPLLALNTLNSPAGAGSEVSLFIYTRVAEDALDLYGFPTQEELAFFKQLMSVSGIGPKTALGILNVADVASLKRAIAAGDSTALTKVFGIGKKSAERLVVELRDKISFASGTASSLASTDGNDAEVVEALMALGYRADEARRVLKEVQTSGTTVNERLAAALKYLGAAKHA